MADPDALLRREETALDLCEGMIDITAAYFNISSKEMREPGRAFLPVRRARQVAMYATHVALGLSMREVARGFALSHRTAQIACRFVEDMRDDPDFDLVVGQIERVAKAALRNRINR